MQRRGGSFQRGRQPIQHRERSFTGIAGIDPENVGARIVDRDVQGWACLDQTLALIALVVDLTGGSAVMDERLGVALEPGEQILAIAVSVLARLNN